MGEARTAYCTCQDTFSPHPVHTSRTFKAWALFFLSFFLSKLYPQCLAQCQAPYLLNEYTPFYRISHSPPSSL